MSVLPYLSNMADTTVKDRIKAALEKANDPALLEAIEFMLTAQDKDWWQQLSDSEKEAIETGLRQANEGRLTPHETILKRLRKKHGL